VNAVGVAAELAALEFVTLLPQLSGGLRSFCGGGGGGGAPAPLIFG
jgi:hypothetical protein